MPATKERPRLTTWPPSSRPSARIATRSAVELVALRTSPKMRTREPPAFSTVCDTLRPEEDWGVKVWASSRAAAPISRSPSVTARASVHSYLKASMGLSPAAFRAG